MEVPAPREVGIANKETLSDQKFDDVLSAIGNSELKAGIIAVMDPNVAYSDRRLYTRVMNAQGNNPGWTMNRHGPLQFCRTTFFPKGLVEKAQPAGQKETNYKLSPFGRDIAKPLAGLLLEFSSQDAKSLYQYFGNITSGTEGESDDGTNLLTYSPLNRYKIFYELVTEGQPIRVADLATRLHLTATSISRYLDALSANQIVTFDRVDYAEPISHYKFIPDPNRPPITFTRVAEMGKRILDLVAQDPNRFWSLKDIEDELVKLPKYANGKDRYATVAGILGELMGQGVLSVEDFKFDIRSQVTLTNEQRDPLVKLVQALDGIQNLDPTTIARGKKFVQALSSNPSQVAYLMEKAKNNSPFANKATAEHLTDQVRAILERYSNSTTRFIQDRLEQDYGKKMQKDSLTGFLNTLASSDDVERVAGKGNRYYWSLKPSNNP